MDIKGQLYGVQTQYSDSKTSSPCGNSPGNHSRSEFGKVYHTDTACIQHNYHQARYQGQFAMGYHTQQDPRQIYAKRKKGLTKLRNVGVIHVIVAVVTIAIGVATLIVASPNIGFPVFNFGVLLVGLLHLVVGFLCFRAGTTGLNSISETSTDIPGSLKGYICGQFGLGVALITLASLAAVFAFLSGAVCAGADITFRSRNNGVERELDVKQYCEPNKSANSALAFVGGSLCILISIFIIYGAIWVCCYGTLFGWRRQGNRIVLA